jgi:flagellar hook-basal body complex protein FliE
MVPLMQAAVSLFGAPLGLTTSAIIPTLSTGFDVSAVNGPISDGASAVAGSGASPAPFADLLTEAVGQVGQLESQARSAVEGLMSGTGVDVHEAMIATEKAEMGFELVLSVRNKALAAYQQMMGMQF